MAILRTVSKLSVLYSVFLSLFGLHAFAAYISSRVTLGYTKQQQLLLFYKRLFLLLAGRRQTESKLKRP